MTMGMEVWKNVMLTWKMQLFLTPCS